MATSNYVLFDIGETQPQSDLVLHPEIEVDVFDPEPEVPKKPPRFYREKGVVQEGLEKGITSLGERATDVIKNVAGIPIAVGETIGSIVSSMAGMAEGGLKSIYAGVHNALGGDIPLDEVVNEINKSVEDYSYQPRTDSGKLITEGFAKVYGGLVKGFEWAANKEIEDMASFKKRLGLPYSEEEQARDYAHSRTKWEAILFGIGGRNAIKGTQKPSGGPSGGGGGTPLEGQLIRPGEQAPRDPLLETQPKPPIEGEATRIPDTQLPAPKEATAEAPYTIFDLEGPTPKKALPAPKASVTPISEATVIKAEKALKDDSIYGEEGQNILSQMRQERLAAVQEKLKTGKNPEGWELPSGKELTAMEKELKGTYDAGKYEFDNFEDFYDYASDRLEVFDYEIGDYDKRFGVTRTSKETGDIESIGPQYMTKEEAIHLISENIKNFKASITDPAVIERKRLAKETEKSVEVEEVPVEEIEVRTKPSIVPISKGRGEGKEIGAVEPDISTGPFEKYNKPADIIPFKDKQTAAHEKLIQDADSYLPDLREQKARAESPEVANAIQNTIDKIEGIRAKAIQNLNEQKAKLEELSTLREGDALHKTESDLNAELNANKSPDGPDVGLSIKRTVEDAPSKVEIPDKAVETFFKETKGDRKAPLKERVSDFMESLWHKMSRTYEHLPNTSEFAELKYGLKFLEKSKGIVSDRTIRLIDSVTYDLGPNNYDVFRKKVVLDDLHFTAGQGKELPRGFTKDQIAVAKQHIDQSIVNNTKVIRALEKRKQVWDSVRTDVIKAYADLGINVDNVFSNPDYFRHLILDKTRAQIIQGTGGKLKVPRGRGYTKKRKGSELDFNTEYIQAEYEVLAGLLNDINIAKTVKLVQDKYNIRPQLEQQFGKEWRKNIPDGYSEYKSDPGHALYLRYTIPESIAEQMLVAASEQLGIPKETIQKSLTLRRDSPNMIVKDEVAITLDNLIKTTKDHPFVLADKKLTRGWKVWALTQPRRLFKYNMRNLTGDAEAAFIGNPSTFRELKTATSELYDMMISGKAPSETLKAWLERGGMQSTLQAAELGDINRLSLFKRLQDKKGALAEIPEKTWQTYWKGARLSTDFREAMFRYAAFRDYLEQMKRNPNGMPDNYGASIREEVQALPNMIDRADKLANDLLGNYTEISVAGQTMRDHIFPFWSFQEINFKRYFRFIDNAMQDGKLPELIGRKLTGTVAKTPLVAARVGILAAKMAALWAVLETWNYTMFPEEEEELPNYIQDGPHIVLGRNEDGSVNYFGNLGILGDFVTWFGFNAAPEGVRDWYAGRKSIGEVAQEMAKQPINKVAQGSFPFVKIAYEEITGTATYPDVFDPKHVRDRGRHFAKFLGLEKEYDQVADRPSVPYHKTLSGFLYYSVNSGEAAYSNIYELKKDYLRKIGKGHEGYLITPASNALYNFKLAIKYKDKDAADKYLQEYMIAGGNIRGIATSLRNMHPLAGIPEEKLPEFANTLSERDAEDLKKALAFYMTTLNPLGIQ